MKVQVLNGGPWGAAQIARAKKLSDDFSNIAKKTALDVKKDAAQNTPVRTGNLKRSWDTRPAGKWDYFVENGASYAAPVEYGTWKMGGRHMLANACHRNAPLYHAAVRAAIMRAK